MLFHTAHWHRAGGYPDEHDHAHELEAIGKAARASGARRQGTRATSLQTLEGQMAAWCNQHAGECTYQLFMHWGSSVNTKPVTSPAEWIMERLQLQRGEGEHQQAESAGFAQTC